MEEQKTKVAIVGKLPPPYFGPAVATKIIIESSLTNYYNIVHFNSRINDCASDIGRVHFSKFPKILSQYKSFRKFLIDEKPSVALIPVSQSLIGFTKDLTFFWLCRRYGVKTILHLRGSELRQLINKASPFIRNILINNIRACNAAIVLGESLRYIFRNLLNENKIFVVPNGFNLDFPEGHITVSAVNILFLSNLQESKGIEDVLQSLRYFSKEEFLNIFLNVAGAWRNKKFKESCETLVSLNHLPVEFHPPASAPDKWKMFANSDIFVFPPRNPEGHPWVIIEAMAAGLPIISTDQGAITESVVDGLNGFIVKPNCPEEIAQKLRFLIEHPEERTRMGKESRRLYEEKFTEERMVENLRRVFESVLNQP